MPVPDEVREAVCGEIEEALRGISVCEDGDGYNYGILDAIAEARGENDLRGAGDVLRDASADIFDAALSALEAAGWEVNRKGTREALEAAEGHLTETLSDPRWHPIGHCPVLDQVRAALSQARGEPSLSSESAK